MNEAPDATPSEAELRRRLGNLATLTTVDDDAWAKFQHRLAETPSSRRRPTPKQLLAAAAAIVAVCAVILTQRDDGGRVRTVDNTTTTTRDETSTTTSTSSPDEGTTTSSMGPGGAPGAATPGVTAGPEGTGATGSGSGSPGGAPDPGETTGTTAPPAPASPGVTAPDGRAVAVSFPTLDYTLQATFEVRGTTFILNVWRLGGSHVSDWVVADQPGHNCLRGENEAALNFPEPGPHLYSWGVVRSDAAEVRIVTTSGDWTTAVIGSEVAPGIRAWVGRRYTEQISHFEALDAAGNILHTAKWDTPQDTC